MPKVRVPRKNVTPGEVVSVLSRRLGPGYQVESNGDRRVTVRKSPLKYATISIADQPGASVFGVHGGGLLFRASSIASAPPGGWPTPCAALPSSAACDPSPPMTSNWQGHAGTARHLHNLEHHDDCGPG